MVTSTGSISSRGGQGRAGTPAPPFGARTSSSRRPWFRCGHVLPMRCAHAVVVAIGDGREARYTLRSRVLALLRFVLEERSANAFALRVRDARGGHERILRRSAGERELARARHGNARAIRGEVAAV